MKIGIITLSASDNCGSLLQTYALKKLLERYGDVDVINFASEKSHIIYDVFPNYKMLIKGFLHIKKSILLLSGKKDYIKFRKEYLNIHGKEIFTEDLYKIKNKYDIVVAGSDQIWNVKMGDFDEAFFCQWTDTKKVAYAPSLGGRHLNLSPNFADVKRWINDFAYLSVREEVGKKCLEEVTGKRVEKVLDPTLVLGENVWHQIAGERLVKEDYIFYYSWAYREDETAKIVSEEGKKSHLPVYVIDFRKWEKYRPENYGFRLYRRTGPSVFLNLMKYAKKCYVESFHGMVFAYIFKKNFWLLDTHEKIEELDSRLMEFITLLNAEDRILTKYNECLINQNEVKKYEQNDLLEIMKAKSKKYLDLSVGGELL